MTGAVEAFSALLRAGGQVEEVDRLACYLSLLERWSAVHSLVKARSRGELVGRHVLESLEAAPHLPPTGLLLDVGSGAGLPGVPLLTALPGWRGVLLEPRQKRWAFLRTAVRELDLDAEVLALRYQELGAEHSGFSAITVRALGSYPELLSWARGRLAREGQLLVWGGLDVVADLGRLDGWAVVSSGLLCAGHGRLVRLQLCFT